MKLFGLRTLGKADLCTVLSIVYEVRHLFTDHERADLDAARAELGKRDGLSMRIKFAAAMNKAAKSEDVRAAWAGAVAEAARRAASSPGLRIKPWSCWA